MKTKILALLFASTGALAIVPPACQGPQKPDGGAPPVTPSGVVDAGAQVVGGICYFIEGIEPTGAAANICATVEEIISAIAFLKVANPDAGTHATAACKMIPQTSYCATDSERYKAVKYIVSLRTARLYVDGGK